MIEALRANLPQILLVFQARGEAFVDLAGNVVASGSATIAADPDKLGLKGAACLGAIVPVLAQAGDNIRAAVSASGSIAGQFAL